MPTHVQANHQMASSGHGHRIELTNLEASAVKIEAIGRLTVRYSLVGVLVAIGAMKFTAYEAEAISGLVTHSPFLSWSYELLSVRGLAAVVGVIELAIAAMIASRPWSAKLSAIGSFLAIGMFMTTLTFLFSTPGVVEPSLGFPALTVLPGQFLAKDAVLLGAAIWAFGDSLKALNVRK